MSIPINLPGVAALRDAVLKKAEIHPRTHADFEALSLRIGGISPVTLERIWGYSTRRIEAISERSLDVLSAYAGHGDWPGFLRHLDATSGRDSDLFTEKSMLSRDLAPGAILRLSWQPDRLLTIRHLGEGRFVVEASEHSSLCPGDRFTAIQFQPGRPLYLDDFSSPADPSRSGRYAIGLSHGLSYVEVLPEGN